jgi:uncharacterized damage-inducible protein DinB
MTYYGGKELARAFRTVRRHTRHIADDIPESHYGFRATPDTRSVAELVAHIAAATGWLMDLHGRDRKSFVSLEDFRGYMAGSAASEAGLKTRPKADLVAALDETGEAFATWLASLSDQDLSESVGFPTPVDPPAKSRFEMLMSAKEHEMHHRAQLMMLERMIGIVPHLTRARQARQ